MRLFLYFQLSFLAPVLLFWGLGDLPLVQYKGLIAVIYVIYIFGMSYIGRRFGIAKFDVALVCIIHAMIPLLVGLRETENLVLAAIVIIFCLMAAAAFPILFWRVIWGDRRRPF